MLPTDLADGAPLRAYVALGSPCVSIYVPAFLRTAAGPPPFVPRELSSETMWRAADALRQRVEADPAAIEAIREVLDPVEEELWFEADEIVDDPTAGPTWRARGAAAPWQHCSPALLTAPTRTLRGTHATDQLLLRPRTRLRPADEPSAWPRPGLVVGDEVVDLSDPAVGLPADMAELLALGPAALDRARSGTLGEGRPLPARLGAAACAGSPARPPSWPSA